MFSRKKILGLTLVVAVIFCFAQPASACTYTYAVKFVCGFNASNAGILSDNSIGGEATVKAGNYATEVNIFNPTNDTDVKKKFIFVVERGQPVGREPKVATVAFEDNIGLPTCTATMDDCNRIAELYYGSPAAVPTPLPLFIGFLVLESEHELDVTSVYTAETCSDWVTLGGAAMCSTPPGIPGVASFGVGLSIDVEQIEGKCIP